MAIVHANAQTFPQEVLQSNETVLVDFWAAWCGNFSRPAHQFDLVCGFQSDHASTPSARRIACVVPSTVDWSSTVFRIPRAS